MRDALVTAQLALSLALLVSSGYAGTFVAVIGLYGVRSYLVSRRIREFGVRMAIGASPADVLSLVLRESLAITAVGLTIGLGLATLLGWGLRGAIYQISPLDPEQSVRAEVFKAPPRRLSRGRCSGCSYSAGIWKLCPLVPNPKRVPRMSALVPLTTVNLQWNCP